MIISNYFFDDRKDFFFQRGSLLYDAGFTLFLMSGYSAGKLFFDPRYIYRVVKRRYFAIKKERTNLVQIEANNLFSGNKPRLEANFSRFLSVYYVGCFFMPLLPMAALFILLSYIAIYFIEKYLFARRYRRPIAISGQLANECLSGLGTGLHIFIVEQF